MLNEYTFYVKVPKGDHFYTIEANDEEPLQSVWEGLIKASHQTREGYSIPADAEYFFFFGGEELVLNGSLSEQGIPPGAQIDVLDNSTVAGFDPRKRIQRDRAALLKLARANPDRLVVEVLNPMEIHLTFRGVRGIRRLDSEQRPVITTDEHKFKIIIPADYPLLKPEVRTLSELFHPNVNPGRNEACSILFWYPEGSDLIYTSWQCLKLIQYLTVNLDGDHPRMNPEAKEWYLKYKEEHPDFFPLGRAGLRLPEGGEGKG